MRPVAELLQYPLFLFGPPPDAPAYVALIVGILLLAIAQFRQRRALRLGLESKHLRWLLGLTAGLAAALSWFYFEWYLRGGPRIIDATAYLLESRILRTGSFTFTPPEPSSLFRSRFLVPAPDGSLGVLFPPGYPAVLALASSLGSYKVLGPFLAASLVWATARLAKEFAAFDMSNPSAPSLHETMLFAGALSALSMTLRYHTAETMSHGVGALLGVGLFYATARLRRIGPDMAPFLLFGLAAGGLLATRPITACALAIPCLWLVRDRLKTLKLALAAIGALPGAALLLLSQKALTGSFWSSAQLRYYALADGPAGCFGLGLGKGCLFEHGDVVSERGFLSPLWALLNSLHRLHEHSLDFANCELLFAVLVLLGIRARSLWPTRLSGAALMSLVLGYALFYFDGSYPGGGARFLAECLPLEHALLAMLLRGEAQRLRVLAVSCWGFAFHGAFSHIALANRDGGAPFLDETLVRAGAPEVLFVGSDHAFLMGYRPEFYAPGHPLRGTLVARRSGDDAEALLLDQLQVSSAREVGQEPPGSSTLAWRPKGRSEPGIFAFEAERQWPALGLAGGWAHPAHSPDGCVSGGAFLAFHSEGPDQPRRLLLGFDGLPTEEYRVTLRFHSPSSGCFEMELGTFHAPTHVWVPLPNQAGIGLDQVRFHAVR